MEKRFLAALLAAVMIGALLPTTVQAGGMGDVERLPSEDYTFENGVLTIRDGVERIGDYAFCGFAAEGSEELPIDSAKITSVIIPSSVTDIGSYAFSDRRDLTSVTIPESVTSVGAQAFGRTGLTSATIPTTIGRSMFYDCTNLTSVIIGNSVTCIDSHAFRKCTSLTSVIIPDSVTSVESYAFEGCTNLTSVIIPNSVTSIGDCAFENCTSLTSVAVPNGVTSIDYAFRGCTSLTSVSIPNSVTSIYRAFEGCTSLTSVSIPNSVTSIYCAFEGCTNLTIYGQAGSYAEQYCKKNNIPFIAGNMPATAQAGHFENADGSDGPAWTITEVGKVTVDATALAPGEAVFVGCYDSNHHFINLKKLDAAQGAAQIDPNTPNVKLFLLGAVQQPLSPSVTVWGK